MVGEEKRNDNKFDPRLDPGDRIQSSWLGRHTRRSEFGRWLPIEESVNWGVEE